MAGAIVGEEWCINCGDVVPIMMDNVGTCPYCGETTKDLVNDCGAPADFWDAPEYTPKSKRYLYTKEEHDAKSKAVAGTKTARDLARKAEKRAAALAA